MRCQSGNRALVDTKGAGDVSLGLVIGEPLQCFLLMKVVELRWAAEPHPTGLCTLSAFTGARPDEFPLEFGYAPQERQQ